MWHTSIGNRVLDGAEWDLFREALGGAWEFIDKLSNDEEQGFQTGVAAFDSLVPAQKLAMLALVGQALRDKTVPAPDRSAVAEATIAAVFATLCIFIEVETVAAEDLELVNDHPTFWRQRVLTAWREVEGAQDVLVSDASCNDLSEWEVLIDDLAKRVLWDDVYECAEEFLDADPEVARVQMQQMGIPADYFLVIAPDPTEDELADIYRTLERLAGRPIGGQLFPGFSDFYHGLLVGPCGQEEIVRENDRRFIEAIGLGSEDEFDCSYQEWVELFRKDVLQAAAQGCDDPADTGIVLTEEQKAQARLSDRSRKPLQLADGYRIEPRDGGWIVVDVRDLALVDVAKGSWAAEDVDDDLLPPVKFKNPREALLAFLRSEAIVRRVAERYDLAMKKLGRPKRARDSDVRCDPMI